MLRLKDKVKHNFAAFKIHLSVTLDVLCSLFLLFYSRSGHFNLEVVLEQPTTCPFTSPVSVTLNSPSETL